MPTRSLHPHELVQAQNVFRAGLDTARGKRVQRTKFALSKVEGMKLNGQRGAAVCPLREFLQRTGIDIVLANGYTICGKVSITKCKT